MKKISLCLLLIVIVSSCLVAQGAGYVPALHIVGDISQPLQLTTMDTFPLQELEYKNDIIEVILLSDLLVEAQPITDDYSILLMADNLVAEFDGKNIEQCYLTFSSHNGWEAINLLHPVSSNIKHLVQLVVIANNAEWDSGINVITPNHNIVSHTVGQLYRKPQTIYLNYEGTSTRSYDRYNIDTSVYTPRRTISIEDILDNSTDSDTPRSILVVGAKGHIMRYQGGQFVLGHNKLDYLAGNRRGSVPDVKGLIIDAPVASNSDAYHDTLHFLEQGERVLVVILDGFGYHQYQYLLEQDNNSLIKDLGQASQVHTVFQPVTNAGLATILTGVTPDINGIYSRQQREVLSPDLFAGATTLGKTSAFVIGDRQIVSTSVQPVFNLDRNENGSTDDEIFQSALGEIDSTDVDLLVVHFKDIDRAGHNFGDFDWRTLKTIEDTLKYTEQLKKVWQGKVIITADHGMHSTNEGGQHGTMRFQDMFVPYIITNGGAQ